jgi:hypothetical protein
VFTARYVLGLYAYNSTFCPHSVFMCFAWISEQTAIISLHSINWRVFITETECVYCAVKAVSFYRIQANIRLQSGCALPQALVVGLSPQRPDRSQVSPCDICGRQSGTNVCLPVLPFFPVSIIPSMLHTPVHLHIALTRRTKGVAWELSKKQCSFGNRWTPDKKVVSLFSVLTGLCRGNIRPTFGLNLNTRHLPSLPFIPGNDTRDTYSHRTAHNTDAAATWNGTPMG